MAQGSFSIQVDEKQSQELKENEWEIIVQVGRGLSNKEIASALNLSEGTVRNNLSHILSKLGLRDRTQLAIWAVQTGAVNRRIDSQDS
jgi:DNA-binding NarL/FixJ family response regulator